MIPIPYAKEILGGAAAILLIVCIALGVSLKTAKARLEANAEHITALEQQIANASQQMLALRSTIEYQNEQIRIAERAGYEAQAAQDKVDELAAKLVNVNALLSRIQRENIDLRARAADLGTCETYELVLRSIAGVLP